MSQRKSGLRPIVLASLFALCSPPALAERPMAVDDAGTLERGGAKLEFGWSRDDAVRGYEGAAAAAYFGAWQLALPKIWGFDGRAFYPPPDPINALLSFGYTLALNDVLAAVQFTGLDPYLGTFHVIEAGRPSLALDLLEEFRPLIVDRLVLELVQTGQITRSQFERPTQKPEAVYLNAAGRALVVDRYEALMQRLARLPTGEETPLRRIVLLQAQAVARVVRGEQERYVGYTP